MNKIILIVISLTIAATLTIWSFQLQKKAEKLEAHSTINDSSELLVRSYFQKEQNSYFLIFDFLADTDKDITLNQIDLDSSCHFKLNVKLKSFIPDTKKLELPSHCKPEKPKISFSIDGSMAINKKLSHQHNHTVLVQTPKVRINSEYTFSAGNHSLDKEWIFGEESIVTFSKGASLLFKEGASLSLFGRVVFPKGKDKPVKMSGDKWGGILLRTKHKTLISNLTIEGGQNLSNNERSTSGSLSIHNSRSVSLKNVVIKNSKASDAIHVKDSNVFFKNLEIYNSLDDGIDFDRGSGFIENITVINSGGDAIDFYHSNLELLNIKARKCQDKGLSVGEKSKIVAKNITISECKTGIALKDESQLSISNRNLFDNTVNIEQSITDKLYSSPGGIIESI